jgi:hypothetical protein
LRKRHGKHNEKIIPRIQEVKSIAIMSKVFGGKLVRNKGMVANAIKHFEGKQVEIIIKEKKKYRTSPQNAYYFGVIIPLTVNAIYNEWGEVWSKEKAHEFFKSRFLFEERVNEQTAEIIQIPKSTTDNTTLEQEEYHNKCVEFLKEWFNVEVPLPNENIRID